MRSDEFGALDQEAVFGRALHGVAERANAARDYGNLVNRVDARQRGGHERVPHLVIGDNLALLRGQDARALLDARDDSLHRPREIVHRYLIAATPCGRQRRFVDEVRKIRTGKTGRDRGDLL